MLAKAPNNFITANDFVKTVKLNESSTNNFAQHDWAQIFIKDIRWLRIPTILQHHISSKKYLRDIAVNSYILKMAVLRQTLGNKCKTKNGKTNVKLLVV